MYIQSKDQENSNQDDQPKRFVLNSVGGTGIAFPAEEQKNSATVIKPHASLLDIRISHLGDWLELTSLEHNVNKKVNKKAKKREFLAEITSVRNVWLKIKTLHFQNGRFNAEIESIFCSLTKLDKVKLDFTGFQDNDFYWRRIIPSLKDLLQIVFSSPSLEITSLVVIWDCIHQFPPNAATCLIEFISEKFSALPKLKDFYFEFRYPLQDELFQRFLNGLQSIEQNLTSFELETTLLSFTSRSHLNMPQVSKCVLKLSCFGQSDSIPSENLLVTFIADSVKNMIKIKELEIEIITEDLEVEAMRQIFAVVNNKGETLTSLRIMISCAAIEENDLALQLKKLVKCAAEEIKESRLRDFKIGVDKMICEKRKGKKEIQKFFRKIRESTI